jgi:hypothetical protein
MNTKIENLKFIVGRDFDGYFENLTKTIMESVDNPLIKRVIVNTGQYLPFEVEMKGVTKCGTVSFLWYSPCRTLGRTTTNEEIVDFLNNLKEDPELTI